MSPVEKLIWWVRWSAHNTPVPLWRRHRRCRNDHRGPLVDGTICMSCARDICADYETSLT